MLYRERASIAREEHFLGTDRYNTYIVGNPTRICTLRQTQTIMTPATKKREYDAKIDSKKRLTIRGARTRHYHVTEYEDGTVELSPRELIHPDEISRRTLQMMDRAMEHLQKGEVSEPVDMDALQDLLEE